MDDIHNISPPSSSAMSPSFLCPPGAPPSGAGAGGGEGLLCPSNSLTRHRRLSSSSMDSSCCSSSAASSNSRLRKSNNKRSSSRVSEFDDINNNENDSGDDVVTLLSFLQSTHSLFRRVGNSSRRIFSTLLRKSKPRPKLVCEGDVLEQTSMICRDYVAYKLTTKELVTRKLPLAAADWPGSSHVIDACLMLEHAYPRIYSNVSRKLCMTMTSTKVVRVALNSLLDVLFEGPTTWGKVVSMFSVCSLFAEECALQGHTDYVPEVVDTVVDFTNNRLLEWLVSQGGWDCFPLPSDDESVCDNFGRVFSFILALTVVCVIVATIVFQYWSCQQLDS